MSKKEIINYFSFKKEHLFTLPLYIIGGGLAWIGVGFIWLGATLMKVYKKE